MPRVTLTIDGPNDVGGYAYVPNASVTLKTYRDSAVAWERTATTDDKGRAEFDVPEGSTNAEVLVRAAGYNVYARKFGQAEAAATYALDITLEAVRG